jgi:glutamate-1-semialdehyde 2,1-aminomutase
MDHIAPDGPVYQAGTLSGNPVAMTAGLRTLELITEDGFYDRLAARTATLVEGLGAAADTAGVPFFARHIGGMFGFFFTDDAPVNTYQQVTAGNIDRFNRFFHGMLDAGHYMAPSAFEAGFVSIKHTEEDVDRTVEAAGTVMETLAG